MTQYLEAKFTHQFYNRLLLKHVIENDLTEMLNYLLLEATRFSLKNTGLFQQSKQVLGWLMERSKTT
jgi:hypothetical protein